jgi:hypothetical protein
MLTHLTVNAPSLCFLRRQFMRRILTVLVLLAMASSVSACACRGGYVGPYGGVHPARCVV